MLKNRETSGRKHNLAKIANCTNLSKQIWNLKNMPEDIPTIL